MGRKTRFNRAVVAISSKQHSIGTHPYLCRKSAADEKLAEAEIISREVKDEQGTIRYTKNRH